MIPNEDETVNCIEIEIIFMPLDFGPVEHSMGGVRKTTGDMPSPSLLM